MIEKHQRYLSEIRGMSQSTVAAYLRSLKRFENFCRLHNMTLIEADEQTITTFLSSLSVSSNTQCVYLGILKQFYQFLVYNELIAYNPAKAVQSPKKVPKSHQTYRIEDIVRLIQTENKNTPVSIRNRTILELYYATGLRCSELANIKLFDVDLSNQLLKVFGKGAKERLVPLNRLAVVTLEKYLHYRQQLLGSRGQSAYLFTSTRSGDKPITRQTLWRLVKVAAEKSGLDKQFTVHTLRHCFATHMLSNGANLRVVQDLLGHSTIQTTQVYTHLQREQLKALHQKHHPRA